MVHTKGPKSLVLELGRGMNVLGVEDILTRLQSALAIGTTENVVVKLASRTSRGILSDVWTALAIGTICARFQKGTSIQVWGVKDVRGDFWRSPFATTLPGITAIQMATVVVSDGGGSKVDRDAVEQQISYEQRGILEFRKTSSRTLCEFDPQQAVALSLIDARDRGSSTARRRLFRELILQFRADLEIGALGRAIAPADAGSMEKLTTFLSELHDNAFEHGRGVSPESPRIRVLRLRKHVATSRVELIQRASDIETLEKYLKDVTYGEGTQAVLEASISDFGPGILDHFLMSPHGAVYREMKRNDVLHNVLLDRLTAKGGDPGAGQGIAKALCAAKEMAGFVSLRTAEFWWARSFSQPGASLSLEEVRRKPCPAVAGTHWQFIWPQPI